MEKNLKNVSLTKILLCTAVLALFTGCFKKDRETPEPEPAPETNSGSFGQLIPIPNLVEGSGDYALDLKTSNEAVYMTIDKSSTNWVYRRQNGGTSTGSWMYHQQPDLYFDWEPCNEKSENPDDFAIYFQTINMNGYVNINTGLPALMQESNPNFGGSSFTGEMLYDNSPGAYKWAFSGSNVYVKQNNSSGLWDLKCTLPTSGGINFAEADPNDAVVWAAAGPILYKITVNGAITSFNVSGYNDPNFFTSSIAKIRFSLDALHEDVYFRYQNKVFKVSNGTSLSLFYTINNGSNFLGGDFAVDASHMYATDGTKKDLNLLTQTNIIPAAPQIDPDNQQVYMDYLSQVNAFNLGPIEVSKNPTDNYIYAIYNTKLLIVPKSR